MCSGYILHDLGDENCIKILRNFRKAIQKENGNVIIVDFVLILVDNQYKVYIQHMTSAYLVMFKYLCLIFHKFCCVTRPLVYVVNFWTKIFLFLTNQTKSLVTVFIFSYILSCNYREKKWQHLASLTSFHAGSRLPLSFLRSQQRGYSRILLSVTNPRFDLFLIAEIFQHPFIRNTEPELLACQLPHHQVDAKMSRSQVAETRKLLRFLRGLSTYPKKFSLMLSLLGWRSQSVLGC